MNPLISVIVPLFNVEQYLIESLKSIQNQSYANIEIILINDGSTDTTRTICEKFSHTENRAKLINTENKGVSSARNIGIEYSSGEYLIFLDPDDLFEPQLIEKLYKQIEVFETDISCCGFTKEYKRTVSSIEKTNEVNLILSPTEALNLILDDQYFKGFVWNKLFSKNIINFPNKIKFDEDIQFCEDLLFCCQAISQSKKISYENTGLYHYFINENSVSKNKFSSKKMTSLNALEKIISLIKNDDLECKNKFETYYTNMVLSLLMNGMKLKKINNSEKEKLIKIIQSVKLTTIKDKKVKFFCFLSKININLSYSIWSLLKKINKGS
jgi:glycosyltransferase involved in cell wall biosynthesis